jgi:ribonuclease HII
MVFIMKETYFIGIDEAGRGSWAWPVVAWAFCVPTHFDFSVFPWLTDSKKLTHKDRERLFCLIEKVSLWENCFFSFGSRDAEIIDAVGIREANRQAMQEALDTLLLQIHDRNISHILIDGRDDYVFERFDNTKLRFIVRWDLTEKVISAASIVAKVTRDRKMCDFSVEYPNHNFQLHKGYGTRKHQDSLMNYGITSLHRKSYAPIKRLISGDS